MGKKNCIKVKTIKLTIILSYITFVYEKLSKSAVCSQKGNEPKPMLKQDEILAGFERCSQH